MTSQQAIIRDGDGGLHTLFDELHSRGLAFPVDVTEIPPGSFISSDGTTLIGQNGCSGAIWRVELLD
jgi:hypothetical protein